VRPHQETPANFGEGPFFPKVSGGLTPSAVGLYENQLLPSITTPTPFALVAVHVQLSDSQYKPGPSVLCHFGVSAASNLRQSRNSEKCATFPAWRFDIASHRKYTVLMRRERAFFIRV